MQVLNSRPSTATLRQAALDDAIGQFMGGFSQMDQQAKTKRAEALAMNEQAMKMRETGYDVTPEMIAQNNQQEPSGIAKFFGAKSPEKVDLYGKRTKEYETKLASANEDKIFKRKSDQVDMDYKNSQIAGNYANHQKTLAEAEKLRNEGANGKQMSATEIAKFDEGNQIPSMLQDIKATISSNGDMFGPVAGRMAAFNPYNEKGKTADSQFRTASQSFGKFMEGGVLRKEDEDKYREMFPKLSDPPEIAANKLANVERLLAQKQGSTIAALKGSGYNVNAIDKQIAIPEVPGILAGKSNSIGNRAQAADPVAIKQQLKSVSREDKIRMLQGR
jgi:hypothetical protein